MALPTTTDLHHHHTAKAGTTVEAGRLTGWADQHTDSIDLSVPVHANVDNGPLLSEQLNGVDVPVFSGDGECLQSSSFTDGIRDNDVATVHAMVKASHGQSDAYLWDHGNSNRAAASFGGGNVSSVNPTGATGGAFPDDEWFVLSIVYVRDNQANYDGCEVYVNGTRVNGTNGAGFSSNGNDLTVGCAGSLNDALFGAFAMAERVTYLARHDQATIDDFVTYMNDEWVAPPNPEITVTLNESPLQNAFVKFFEMDAFTADGATTSTVFQNCAFLTGVFQTDANGVATLATAPTEGKVVGAMVLLPDYDTEWQFVQVLRIGSNNIDLTAPA